MIQRILERNTLWSNVHWSFSKWPHECCCNLVLVPSTSIQNIALYSTRHVTGALFYSGHAAAVTVVFMYPRARKEGRRKEAAKRSDAPPSHARMRKWASPVPARPPCIFSKYFSYVAFKILLSLYARQKYKAPSIKVRKVEKLWNKIRSAGCKWSNLNAIRTETPVSHSLLGDSLFPFSAPAASFLPGVIRNWTSQYEK